MLYYLVGSRGLDGGLMCTASHNPKAYTGAKLVREGAIALSGDAGIQDIRRTIEAGLGESAQRSRHRGGGGALRGVPGGGAEVHRPERREAAEGGGGRRQRHGGPDGGARCWSAWVSS